MKNLITFLILLLFTNNSFSFSFERALKNVGSSIDQELKKVGDDLGVSRKNHKEKSRELNNKLSVFLNEDDADILRTIIDHSECILFVEGAVKVAIGVGGQTGVGIGTCRLDDGRWSTPSYYRLTALSGGVNLGLQTMDIILGFSNRDAGIDALTAENISIGAESTITLGSVGREANISLNLDDNISTVYSYANTQGILVDLASVKAYEIRPEKRLNRQIYRSLNNYGLPNNAQEQYFKNTPKIFDRFLDQLE